jgi:excisionase family DNA binding protein
MGGVIRRFDGFHPPFEEELLNDEEELCTMAFQVTAPVLPSISQPSDRDLLKLYLSLPKSEKERRFADTARTAEILGLSRRTIQLWIELGQIRAVRVGKRYHVLLDSVHCYLDECIAC